MLNYCEDNFHAGFVCCDKKDVTLVAGAAALSSCSLPDSILTLTTPSTPHHISVTGILYIQGIRIFTHKQIREYTYSLFHSGDVP